MENEVMTNVNLLEDVLTIARYMEEPIYELGYKFGTRHGFVCGLATAVGSIGLLSLAMYSIQEKKKKEAGQ